MIFPLPYSLPLRNSILFDEYELLSSLSHKGKNRKEKVLPRMRINAIVNVKTA